MAADWRVVLDVARSLPPEQRAQLLAELGQDEDLWPHIEVAGRWRQLEDGYAWRPVALWPRATAATIEPDDGGWRAVLNAREDVGEYVLGAFPTLAEAAAAVDAALVRRGWVVLEGPPPTDPPPDENEE